MEEGKNDLPTNINSRFIRMKIKTDKKETWDKGKPKNGWGNNMQRSKEGKNEVHTIVKKIG